MRDKLQKWHMIYGAWGVGCLSTNEMPSIWHNSCMDGQSHNTPVQHNTCQRGSGMSHTDIRLQSDSEAHHNVCHARSTVDIEIHIVTPKC